MEISSFKEAVDTIRRKGIFALSSSLISLLLSSSTHPVRQSLIPVFSILFVRYRLFAIRVKEGEKMSIMFASVFRVMGDEGKTRKTSLWISLILVPSVIFTIIIILPVSLS
jgi:hypothetical protein